MGLHLELAGAGGSSQHGRCSQLIGRRLGHYNVVRTFQSMDLKKSGEIQISGIGKGPENYSIILYIQDPGLNVSGAVQYIFKEQL